MKKIAKVSLILVAALLTGLLIGLLIESGIFLAVKALMKAGDNTAKVATKQTPMPPKSREQDNQPTQAQGEASVLEVIGQLVRESQQPKTEDYVLSLLGPLSFNPVGLGIGTTVIAAAQPRGLKEAIADRFNEITQAMEEDLRQKTAAELGLPPTATREDIRKKMAMDLGLEPKASWKEILEQIEKAKRERKKGTNDPNS